MTENQRRGSVAASVGCLTAVLLASGAWTQNIEPFTAELTIRADQPKGTINRNIYSHFAEHLGRCIYEGNLGRPGFADPQHPRHPNDVVAALKNLSVPVLRWPGGCFADEYHWREGIGPRNQRPKRINTHWGGVIERTISAPTSSWIYAR
jgi:alpha-L-arabinofuranosidase